MSLGVGVWISIPVLMLLVRSFGITLGAGDGGASNAIVLRLIAGAAVALFIDMEQVAIVNKVTRMCFACVCVFMAR